MFITDEQSAELSQPGVGAFDNPAPFVASQLPANFVSPPLMGKAALDAPPAIARIHLAMLNLHYLPTSLSPFGLDIPNHIFALFDEPHGTIEATIER